MATRNRPQPGGLSVVKLSEVGKVKTGARRKRTPWLWADYMPPGALGMLDGDPGLGKSMITCDLAARVSVGGKMPLGAQIPPGNRNVLMVAKEDTPEEIRARVEAFGGNPDNVSVVRSVGGRTLSIPDDVPILRDFIVANKVRLVIIDPIMVYLGKHAGAGQQVRQAVDPLADLAQSTGATIIMVRHLTKGGGKNAKQAGGGAMDLIGSCRFGFLIGPDPENPKRRIMACTKMNNAAEPLSVAYTLATVNGAPKVVWEDKPVDNLDAEDLMRNRRVNSDERNEREEAVNFLRDTLEEEGGVRWPVEIMQLAREAGFTSAQIRTAKRKLRVVSRKLGIGWWWCMPEFDIRKFDQKEAQRILARAAAEKDEKTGAKGGKGKAGAGATKLTVVRD